VPYPAVEAILEEIAEALTDKVVIDVTNPIKPDYSGLATEGTSAAEQIQARVAGGRVVKAFNTVFASRLPDPVVDGVPFDGLVAGDDDAGKRTVLALLDELGFRPIDAGPITMARALEWMGSLNISLQIRNDWSWQTAWKLSGRPAPQGNGRYSTSVEV
jgi:predicted dinucleotide-binding enzyme